MKSHFAIKYVGWNGTFGGAGKFNFKLKFIDKRFGIGRKREACINSKHIMLHGEILHLVRICLGFVEFDSENRATRISDTDK